MCSLAEIMIHLLPLSFIQSDGRSTAQHRSHGGRCSSGCTLSSSRAALRHRAGAWDARAQLRGPPRAARQRANAELITRRILHFLRRVGVGRMSCALGIVSRPASEAAALRTVSWWNGCVSVAARADDLGTSYTCDACPRARHTLIRVFCTARLVCLRV